MAFCGGCGALGRTTTALPPHKPLCYSYSHRRNTTQQPRQQRPHFTGQTPIQAVTQVATHATTHTSIHIDRITATQTATYRHPREYLIFLSLVGVYLPCSGQSLLGVRFRLRLSLYHLELLHLLWRVGEVCRRRCIGGGGGGFVYRE